VERRNLPSPEIPIFSVQWRSRPCLHHLRASSVPNYLKGQKATGGPTVPLFCTALQDESMSKTQAPVLQRPVQDKWTDGIPMFDSNHCALLDDPITSSKDARKKKSVRMHGPCSRSRLRASATYVPHRPQAPEANYPHALPTKAPPYSVAHVSCPPPRPSHHSIKSPVLCLKTLPAARLCAGSVAAGGLGACAHNA